MDDEFGMKVFDNRVLAKKCRPKSEQVEQETEIKFIPNSPAI
jgi:hypothetical protein